jgi:solute carrier family 25 iron transporter 28/37
MQIINPSAGGLYTGLSHAVSTIYRIEGLRTLWRGVSSVIVGAGGFVYDEWEIQDTSNTVATGPAHAVYFGTYEIVKEAMGGNKADGKHHPLAAGMQAPTWRDAWESCRC